MTTRTCRDSEMQDAEVRLRARQLAEFVWELTRVTEKEFSTPECDRDHVSVSQALFNELYKRKDFIYEAAARVVWHL